MKKSTTSIVFTGDIGFDRYMDRKWEDENLLSQSVLDFFHSADHVCANVEGALIDAEDDGSRGVFFHAMNPAATCVLEKMHADIWSIGNNHTMDAGVEGVISTKKIVSIPCRVTIPACEARSPKESAPPSPVAARENSIVFIGSPHVKGEDCNAYAEALRCS